MKKLGIACVLLFSLSACLTTAPQYTPAQLESMSRIEFVNFETLPEDKHIKIIGQTKGNYGIKYGNPAQMEQEMRAGAYSLNGDAILPYSTSRQYISIADATIINGVAGVVAYVEPEKNLILSDFSKGENGGLVALSAARFAADYPESADISRQIIESHSKYKDGSRMVAAALNALAKVNGQDSKDYFFDYIIKASSRNSYNAFMAISPYINKQDKEKLVRFLKFHEYDAVKIESAKQLIKLGERKAVEDYAEKTNNPALAKLLM